MKARFLIVAMFLCAVLFLTTEISAQTTAFSYQGTLSNGGSPASGAYEMQFRLFDSAGTQTGSTVSRPAVTVTNGAFAVSLDFGVASFNGADRFLEISVKPPTCPMPPCQFTTLSPRTQILSAPYAVRAVTVSGPVTGTNSSATLTVSNDQPGITDPSPANLPPAALKGEATSTSNSNIGVLGIGDGSMGIGVLGLTNGSGGTGQADAIGVVALATSTTGKSTGLSAQISSPDGAAIEAQTSATGSIFEGNSDDSSSSNPKFVVTHAGSVIANGQIIGKSFFLGSGNMQVTPNGNIGTVGTIEGASLTTSGDVTVGGNLNATNLSLGSLTTTGNVNVGGTLQANFLTAPGGTFQVTGGISATGNGLVSGTLTGGNVVSNNNLTVGGTLQVSQITSPGGNISFNSSNIGTSGEGGFGLVRTSLLSGGDSPVCIGSTQANYLRFCSSSLRYKKDVQPFTMGLNLVKRLRPITFVWKESGVKDVGLGAEDVAKVDPRLTFQNANGEVEGVKYGQLNVVLINAIKQQQEQIEALRADNAALSSRLHSVERSVRKSDRSRRRR